MGPISKGSRRIWYVLGVLILGVLTLEVGARVLGGPAGARSLYREMSQEFAQLRQLRQDLRTCGEAGREVLRVFSVLGAALRDGHGQRQRLLLVAADAGERPGGSRRPDRLDLRRLDPA